MKFLVAFSCLVAVALAVEDVQVIRNILDVQPESYSYGYELGNGISAQESGSLKNPEAISAQGSYQFTAPDGQVVKVSYVADENGFQPSSDLLPVGPEIPILIQKSLAYLASAKPYIFVLIGMLAVVTAAPQGSGDPIPIIRQEQEVNFDGSYKFNYETGNGITAEETGFLKNAGNPDTEAQVAQGRYSYTAPDGQLITVVYTADENGFQAQGDHLPTPPPIPPAIQRALEYLATAPPQPEQGSNPNAIRRG
ncbi:uncharacterized protein LOC129911826 [Episyrphus balteatus]|uniref:uncharacterized protein LOC129911826 n=1 Tax=Episyrphus balteatus TaxID=286459 RepID=UPI00248695C4|nr:uncharacterized protein LOC129911826 [Episyrphus balteatus]